MLDGEVAQAQSRLEQVQQSTDKTAQDFANLQHARQVEQACLQEQIDAAQVPPAIC